MTLAYLLKQIAGLKLKIETVDVKVVRSEALEAARKTIEELTTMKSPDKNDEIVGFVLSELVDGSHDVKKILWIH